jgi:hypothetical protein
MEKIILILVCCLMLTGCLEDIVKDPVCADKPVYRQYDINVPPRPPLNNLEGLTNSSTPGQVVRAYELDTTVIMEYAISLENLIKPIANKEAILPIEPPKVD